MINTYKATKHDNSTVYFNADGLINARRYCIMYLHFIPTLLELA